jgi:5'-nucleotidase
MKRTFAAGLLVSSLVLVGCQNNEPAGPQKADAAVLDVNPQPNQNYQPAPQPVITSTPAYQPAPAPAPVAAPVAAAPTGGTRHVVQKGETLYGIAQAKLGAGKEWPRIVQANPGLTPENLKAGQTIIIP